MNAEGHQNPKEQQLPEKRRQTGRDMFAEKLRELLDRSGGVAKMKFLPRFQNLLEKEMRLKHRFTLLTVLRLTQSELLERLLEMDLFQILLRWVVDAMGVTSETCVAFLAEMLKFLLDIDVSPIVLGAESRKKWRETLNQLHQHNESEICQLSQQISEKWIFEGVLTRISLPLASSVSEPETKLHAEINKKTDPLDDGSMQLDAPVEDPQCSSWKETGGNSCSDSLLLDVGISSKLSSDEFKMSDTIPTTTSQPPVRDDVRSAPTRSDNAVASMAGEKMSKRVEGLHAPLPKAFQSKPLMHNFLSGMPSKRRKVPKKVHWAAPEFLVSVRVFHETDLPCQLLSESVPEVSPETEWMMPVPVKLDPSWKVRYGEESTERIAQDEREERIASVDPELLIGGRDPFEPFYLCDTVQDAEHKPKILPLENPKKAKNLTPQAPQPQLPAVKPPETVPTQRVGLWPGMSIVPSGSVFVPQTTAVTPLMHSFVPRPIFQSGIQHVPQTYYLVHNTISRSAVDRTIENSAPRKRNESNR